MFNFTTQTILNSVVSKAANAADVNKANVITSTDKQPTVRIGNVRLSHDAILDVQRKNHSEEHLTSVTFNLANLLAQGETSANFRIALYVSLSMNSQEAFYANDLVYKGKPLYIEFSIKSGETGLGAKVANIAKKYFLFTTQEPIFTVTSNEDTVTITGVNGFQMLTKASLQKFTLETSPIDCCSTVGDFVDIVTGLPFIWKIEGGQVKVDTTKVFADGKVRALAAGEVGIKPGVEAFGDYNWMIHNLRIPTGANTDFWAPTKSEMPVVGNTYDQFIVRLCVDRDGIAGEAVGQRVTSVTTHVFYVNSASSTAFANLIFGEDFLNKTVDTDADKAMADPFHQGTESEGGGNENNNVIPEGE